LFVDAARVFVKGGRGGNGAASMRREKYVPEGGPDGGDGGAGGGIAFVVDPALQTLMDFQYRRHFNAEKGGNGEGSNRHGRRGGELVVRVPCGTMVYDEAEGGLIADLDTPGQRAVVARGGSGGRGNARFVTSVNRAPRLAEKGEPGEERWLRLELKLLADVGLVGYPNVGKSTVLAAISAARPKIADYPFTTLSPNLGVVFLGEERSFVVADIPGLIEGAHQGAGLGQDFLRHIERTRVLIHVLDPSRDPACADPVEAALHDYETINSELASYEPALARVPQVVAVNKTDLPAVRASFDAIAERLAASGATVLAVSAATREGLKDLLEATWKALAAAGPPRALRQRWQDPATAGRGAETAPQADPADPALAGGDAGRAADTSGSDGLRIYRYRARNAFSVAREGGVLVVSGRGIERLAAMTDFDNIEGFHRFDHLLDRWGVTDALRAAGAVEGDTVRIGKIEFAFHEDRGTP
jgi:GTP-binding protein